MSQITIELNNPEDENLLLSLLQRLGIRYSIVKKETVEKNPHNHLYPLRGTKIQYKNPTEPVAIEDWEILK